MSDPIRILVAEDHLVARVGVTAIVNMQPDMTVVAEAANGQQAVEMFRQHQPDVTLLDLRMPGMSGVEAAIAIRAEFPQAHMIALTTYGGDEDIRRALAAGVQAYLTKDVLHDELLKAIRAVHAGQTYLPAAVAAALAAQMPRPDLSAREVQVLELIVRGLANKQIAYSLSIAEHTVKNHVKSILSKLGVQDRTQAATAAIQRGLQLIAVLVEHGLGGQDISPDSGDIAANLLDLRVSRVGGLLQLIQLARHLLLRLLLSLLLGLGFLRDFGRQVCVGLAQIGLGLLFHRGGGIVRFPSDGFQTLAVGLVVLRDQVAQFGDLCRGCVSLLSHTGSKLVDVHEDHHDCH
jgi:two-component system, NarL family, response regulator